MASQLLFDVVDHPWRGVIRPSWMVIIIVISAKRGVSSELPTKMPVWLCLSVESVKNIVRVLAGSAIRLNSTGIGIRTASAHGDIMAFGTMFTILFTWWFQSMGLSLGALPTALLALPFAIVVCALFVLLSDRLVYRFYRIQRADPVIFVIASVGIMFVMNGLVRFIIGSNDQNFAAHPLLRTSKGCTY